MSSVLRWGQSAYETDADIELEAASARALGLSFRAVSEATRPDDLDLAGVSALVVTSRVKVTEAVLSRFSGSLVLTTTSGWEHIDVLAAKARGITVARCPLARRDAVVEQTVGAILAMLRRQPSFTRAARQGRWARAELPALDPLLASDATILVVGLGVIGRQLAERLRPFGSRLLGVDPRGVPDFVEPVSIDEGIARADVVTLHCALNADTEWIISKDRVAAMRRGATLVNTARGRLVDVPAAVEATHRGDLGGLVLDVFPEEPWLLMREAAQHENIWLTPHSAGYTRGLGTRVAREVADALRALVSGAPIPHSVEGIG